MIDQANTMSVSIHRSPSRTVDRAVRIRRATGYRQVLLCRTARRALAPYPLTASSCTRSGNGTSGSASESNILVDLRCSPGPWRAADRDLWSAIPIPGRLRPNDDLGHRARREPECTAAALVRGG